MAADDVYKYFTLAAQLNDTLISCRRGSGCYSQIFSRRLSIERKLANWRKLQRLVIQRAESDMATVTELRHSMAESFVAIRTEYDIARADMETVQFHGEFGPASEVLYKFAGQILDWLHDDLGRWKHYGCLKTADDVDGLERVFDASDQKFPFRVREAQRIREALNVQRSQMLRHCKNVVSAPPAGFRTAIEIAELFTTPRGTHPNHKHLAKTLQRLPSQHRQKSGSNDNSAWIYNAAEAVKLVQEVKANWHYCGQKSNVIHL